MAKQKSGLYRTKVVIGHDRDGKPITKYISGKTKKELEENRQEILRHYATGALEVQRDVSFKDYALEWYTVFKKPKVSRSTQQNYESAFNQRINPWFKERQLRSITATDLQVFTNSMSGMSSSSIDDTLAIIRNTFALAYNTGIIDRNPALHIEKPDSESESRRALTEAEKAAVLEVGKSDPEGFFLLLLYYTGLRRGEALGLRWEDVDLKEKMIAVRRDVDFATGEIGKLKSEKSERSVPIPPALEDLLRSRRGVPKSYLIPAPRDGGFMGKSTYERMWRRLSKAIANFNLKQHEKDPKTEIIETKEGRSVLTPHYFRHNYCSILYNAGVDVVCAQRYMGHADITTTLRIYTHLSAKNEDENAQKVRSAFG